jgi:hypothetical protein
VQSLGAPETFSIAQTPTTAGADLHRAQTGGPVKELPANGVQVHFHEPDPINFDEHDGFVSLFDGKL